MKRKILASVLAVALILSLSPFMLGATISTGDKHWADDSIAVCDEMGVLDGLAKSEYSPDEKATRGDMFKMMDNIMNYPDAATDKSFADLDVSHPHYKTLMKLAAAGIANGYDDGTMRPDAPVTREEAMVIFARAFGVDENSSASYLFSDGNAIGEWAQPLVGGMRQRGFIAGYPDGSFGPKLNVSMSELAKMIDNMLAGIASRADTYTTDFGYGCAVVNVTGVTLKDLTVEGDLIAAAGIGKGDLILDSVTVRGRLIVNGGGVNSIIIRGSSSVGTIVVDNSAGGVSIKVQGDADVEIIYVDDGSDEVFIEGMIGSLVIGDEADVTLRSGASAGDISIQGDEASLTISSGASAGNLDISGDGNSVVVTGTLKNGVVSSNENSISGTGKITGVVTYTGGEDNTITVVGTKVEVKEGAGDVKAGKEILTSGDDTTIPGSTTSTGNGGGGYVSPTTPTPTPTPTPTAAQTFAESLNSTYGAGTATFSGSVVTLVNDVVLTADLTVPSGVTLTVDADKTLTIAEGKRLTVEANALITVKGSLVQHGADSTGDYATEGVLDLAAASAKLDIEDGGIWSVKTGLVGAGIATIKSGGCYFSYGSEISKIADVNACKIVHESGSFYYYGVATNESLPTTKVGAKTAASAIFLDADVATIGAPTTSSVRWSLGTGAKIVITRASKTAQLCTEIVTGSSETKWGQIKAGAGYNTTISGNGVVEIPVGINIGVVAGQTVTVNSGATLKVTGTLTVIGTLITSNATIVNPNNITYPTITTAVDALFNETTVDVATYKLTLKNSLAGDLNRTAIEAAQTSVDGMVDGDAKTELQQKVDIARRLHQLNNVNAWLSVGPIQNTRSYDTEGYLLAEDTNERESASPALKNISAEVGITAEWVPSGFTENGVTYTQTPNADGFYRINIITNSNVLLNTTEYDQSGYYGSSYSSTCFMIVPVPSRMNSAGEVENHSKYTQGSILTEAQAAGTPGKFDFKDPTNGSSTGSTGFSHSFGGMTSGINTAALLSNNNSKSITDVPYFQHGLYYNSDDYCEYIVTNYMRSNIDHAI